LEQLGRGYAREGKDKQFDILSPYLEGTEKGCRYADLAAELEVSEAVVRVAIGPQSRMRDG
jgi:hypothetical protein